MVTLEQALASMHNGQWWGWTNPNGDKVLSNVTIHDTSKSLPTQDEVDAKITELKLDEVRAERNAKLAETDWMANSDVTMSDSWKTYRQALRDITDSATSLDDVTWPTKPE